MVVNSKIGIFNSIAVLAQYIGAPPCLSPPVVQYSMFVRFLASSGGWLSPTISADFSPNGKWFPLPLPHKLHSLRHIILYAPRIPSSMLASTSNGILPHNPNLSLANQVAISALLLPTKGFYCSYIALL